MAFFGFNHVKFTGINNFCKNIGPSLRVSPIIVFEYCKFPQYILALYLSVAIGEREPSITGGNT